MTDRRELLQQFVAEVRDQQGADFGYFEISKDAGAATADFVEAHLAQGRSLLDKKPGERGHGLPRKELEKLVGVQDMRDAGVTWRGIVDEVGDSERNLRAKLGRHATEIMARGVSRAVHMKQLRSGLKEMG